MNTGFSQIEILEHWKSVSKLIQLRWILWWYSHEPYLHENNIFLWPFGNRLVRIQRFLSSFQSLIIYFVHNFFVVLCGDKSICRFSGLFAGDLFRMVSNRFFGYHHESIVASDARDRTNFDPHRVNSPIETGKTDLFWANYENCEKINISEKIPVGWIKKTLTDARSRRLPRGLTKTLSSCKYEKTSFYRLKMEKECLAKNTVFYHYQVNLRF